MPTLDSLEKDQILQTLLHYRTVLVRFGLIITRDFHAAEDIYQNLVIKALNAIIAFENKSQLLLWCRTVIRTEAVDWMKKNDRELLIDDARLIELLDAEIFDEMKETRNLIAWSETLNDCLKKLSGESQKILLLRYEGERNCSEVASLMGISLDSVYKRLSRIHLKLRDCVNTTAGMNSPSRRIINES